MFITSRDELLMHLPMGECSGWLVYIVMYNWKMRSDHGADSDLFLEKLLTLWKASDIHLQPIEDNTADICEPIA